MEFICFLRYIIKGNSLKLGCSNIYYMELMTVNFETAIPMDFKYLQIQFYLFHFIGLKQHF
jgi:hypothetical protein